MSVIKRATRVVDGRRITRIWLEQREVDELAFERQDTHGGPDSEESNRTYFGPKDQHMLREIMGAAGELAFSYETGLPVDRTRRRGGDNGVDFRAGPHNGKWTKIDVKTARKIPTDLPIAVDKLKGCAHILVLAKWYDDYSVELIGWVAKPIIAMEPIKKLEPDNPKAPFNHCHPVEELEEMWKLYNLLARKDGYESDHRKPLAADGG